MFMLYAYGCFGVTDTFQLNQIFSIYTHDPRIIKSWTMSFWYCILVVSDHVKSLARPKAGSSAVTSKDVEKYKVGPYILYCIHSVPLYRI